MSSSATRRPDFDARAADYDRIRPVDRTWWNVFELVVREADLAGRRVLDVGCGTGRLERALVGRARLWGVDPSPAMLERARENVPHGARFKRGSAEQLPFKDGWFERVIMWLVVHLVDRPRAFAEAARVLTRGGRLAIVTFDERYFGTYWLNRFFPSLEAIDRARFPTEAQLRVELEAQGFEVDFVKREDASSLTRAEALERVHGRHISTFDLLDEDELRAGTERAERELPERVDYRIKWLVAVATQRGAIRDV
jgi:SAM-dependent methyltransferase